MVKIGILSDMHFRPDSADDPSGVDPSAFQADYDDLVNNKNVDDVFLLGDHVHPATTNGAPHVPSSAHDRLWDDIVAGTTDGGDSIRHAIPGNHDVPIGTFAKSDERAGLTKRFAYDADGVTTILLNTQANSHVTGHQVQSGQEGAGVAYPRALYRDIKWMDDQLSGAGSDAKLILPHAPTYFTHSMMNNGTGFQNAMYEGDTYWVVQNYRFCHDVLQQYGKVVELAGHIYGGGSDEEGHHTVDGVDYCGKQHYMEEGGDVATYHVIDIDSSGVTITGYEHSSSTTHTVIDKTF